MKKILIVCLVFLFSIPAFADSTVICPTDTAQPSVASISEIENQIWSNWMHSGGAWYASWAQVQMGSYLGSGGVRGPMNNGMPSPQDRKPRLRYLSYILQNDTDRGEIEVDCQYLIDHDPEVFDRNYPSLTSVDNLFWMKVFLIGSTSQCHKVSNTTVVCS